jgi:hypothetical protein
MTDVRNIIVDWAKWGVDNHKNFIYTEDATRMSAINVWPPKFPIHADCSASVTLWYNLAGAADPNGNHYNGYGYTGTLLTHGKHIDISQVIPGDVVVYGPGTGWHTALVVEVHGHDILTISHGQQGDPSYVWVNPPKTVPSHGYYADARTPQTYLRFDTTAVGKIHKPSDLTPHPAPIPTPPKPATPPVKHPTIAQGTHGPAVKQAQLLLNKAGAKLVVDGIFGTQTFSAVKQFQTAHNLIATGVVSDATWQLLDAHI